MAQDTEINRKTQCDSKSQSSVTCLQRPIIQCRCPGWRIFYTTELWELKKKRKRDLNQFTRYLPARLDWSIIGWTILLLALINLMEQSKEQSKWAYKHIYFLLTCWLLSKASVNKIIAYNYGYGFEQTQRIKFWCEAHPALFVLQTWMIPQILQLIDYEMNKFTILPGWS